MACSTQTTDDSDATELRMAARLGELDEVRTTLASASVALVDAADPETGNTAMHMAAANGHSAVVSALVAFAEEQGQGAKSRLLNAQNRPSRNTALHWAAFNGQLDSVRILVQAGADLAIENAYGRNPLDEAHAQSHAAVAAYLVEAAEQAPSALDSLGDFEMSAGTADDPSPSP